MKLSAAHDVTLKFGNNWGPRSSKDHMIRYSTNQVPSNEHFILYIVCAHAWVGHLSSNMIPAAFDIGDFKLTWMTLTDRFGCKEKHRAVFHVITVSISFRVSIHF